jgi:hypothetical protein
LKLLNITIAICLIAAAAYPAWAERELGFEEVLAIYRKHTAIYDACYLLSREKVLPGTILSDLRKNTGDTEKSVACGLGITSQAAGIRITDAASLQKLQDINIARARCMESEVDLHNARTALESYYLDNGKYPSDLKDLGSYASSFKSSMTYRLDSDGRYAVFSNNPGCDKTLYISTDSTEIRRMDSTPAQRK